MGWGLTCAFFRLFLVVARIRDSPIPSPLLVTAIPSHLHGLDSAVVGDMVVATGARRGCCRNGWAVVRKCVGVSKMGGWLKHVWAVGSGLMQVRVFGVCHRPCWGSSTLVTWHWAGDMAVGGHWEPGARRWVCWRSSTPVMWQLCAVRFGVQKERGEGGG